MDSDNSKKPKHKLAGKWKITLMGDTKLYPWAIDLPVDATFEITEDLHFKPDKLCGGKFKDPKPMSKTQGDKIRLFSENSVQKLLHHGTVPARDDQGVPLAKDDDSVLTMQLASGEDIYFTGDHEGGKGTIEIHGPDHEHKLWASMVNDRLELKKVLLRHGGPHGIAN